MSKDKIDVRGLPARVTRAISAVVQAMREETAKSPKAKPSKRTQLNSWPGKIKGKLARRELYKDAV